MQSKCTCGNQPQLKQMEVGVGKGSPEVREVLSDGDVVHPGPQLRVKELKPILSYVEHQGATEKQVLKAEAGSHSSEIKKVSDVVSQTERVGEESDLWLNIVFIHFIYHSVQLWACFLGHMNFFVIHFFASFKLLLKGYISV